jgi:hypothetical protein
MILQRRSDLSRYLDLNILPTKTHIVYCRTCYNLFVNLAITTHKTINKRSLLIPLITYPAYDRIVVHRGEGGFRTRPYMPIRLLVRLWRHC